MKFWFSFFILFLFSFFSYAQVDSLAEEKGDTLETIISDTSIIYIIQVAPVTIREKIEIVRPKEKKKYYLSIDFSLLQFHEHRKASPPFEGYVSTVNSDTKNNKSYTMGADLSTCPNKVYRSLSLDFMRLNQRFEYSNDTTGQNYKTDNRTNYAAIGMHVGYWFRKNKKTSMIIHGGIHGKYLLSYSGFTLNYSPTENIKRLNETIKYKTALPGFSINFRIIDSFKNTFLFIEPYVMVAPFSATQKDEVYSITRTFVGIKVGFSNNLF